MTTTIPTCPRCHGRYTPPAVATDRERLREFALTVEQVLRADDLTDLGKLARIAVAHARLTGRAER